MVLFGTLKKILLWLCEAPFIFKSEHRFYFSLFLHSSRHFSTCNWSLLAVTSGLSMALMCNERILIALLASFITVAGFRVNDVTASHAAWLCVRVCS